MHSQLVSIRGVDELMHRRKHSARGVRLWSCSPRFQGTRRCACAAMLYRCAGRPVTELPAWAPSQGATWARACLGREGPGWLGAAFFQRALISMIDFLNVAWMFNGDGDKQSVQKQHSGAARECLKQFGRFLCDSDPAQLATPCETRWQCVPKAGWVLCVANISCGN